MIYRLIIIIFSLTTLFGCSQIDKDIQNIGSDSAYPETVGRAKIAITDTWVILTGKIITHVGDEIYIFQDSTGKIRINIDNVVWAGLNFNPNLQVTIKGKVIQGISGVMIDVTKIEENSKQP